MSAPRRVLIIGSGPTGSTYARRIIDADPSLSVVMVEAGPRLTEPAGMNVRNIPDPKAQLNAKLASQGPASGQSGVGGIPAGAVAEGTVTARQGTHLIGANLEGSTGMPAAAGATCVGGQGAHWTCATPRPEGSERIDFIDEGEWEHHIKEAEGLLHTTAGAFHDSPQAGVILDLVSAELAPDGITVGPLPVAGDPQSDGSMRWSGVDVVLGDLAERGATAQGRFELRPRTLCTRLVRDDNRVVGAVLRDLESGVEEEVGADAVVVAADALRTPQLLWASGIRPPALGRYLTEHPLLFGVVAVRDGILPPRSPGAGPIDPVRAVIGIRFDEVKHPFHAQLLYSPVCPVPLPEDSPYQGNPGGYVGMGWGVRKWPSSEDRVTFDDDQLDATGLPGVRIAYERTAREDAEIEAARGVQKRVQELLGEFLPGMPVVMPNGSSLHYMGTVRMGPTDDGTSVCDPGSRVWGVPGLFLAGNGLIPTANSCNPTLTSVALALRGAEALLSDLLDD